LHTRLKFQDKSYPDKIRANNSKLNALSECPRFAGDACYTCVPDDPKCRLLLTAYYVGRRQYVSMSAFPVFSTTVARHIRSSLFRVAIDQYIQSHDRQRVDIPVHLDILQLWLDICGMILFSSRSTFLIYLNFTAVECRSIVRYLVFWINLITVVLRSVLAQDFRSHVWRR
jgi:hypothetical protein